MIHNESKLSGVLGRSWVTKHGKENGLGFQFDWLRVRTSFEILA